MSDLHSDQLSQAVLLRFAESGRLASTIEKPCAAGLLRLKACMQGCANELPIGSTLHTSGGRDECLGDFAGAFGCIGAGGEGGGGGCHFFAGAVFLGDASADACLAVEFCGVAPLEISRGMKILGTIFRKSRSGRGEGIGQSFTCAGVRMLEKGTSSAPGQASARVPTRQQIVRTDRRSI